MLIHLRILRATWLRRIKSFYEATEVKEMLFLDADEDEDLHYADMNLNAYIKDQKAFFSAFSPDNTAFDTPSAALYMTLLLNTKASSHVTFQHS